LKVAALLVLCLASACGPFGSESVARYNDLVRLVPKQAAGADRSVRVEVWDVEGDRRPTLVQDPPGRVLLGPIPPGSACQLRAGLALDPPAWPSSPDVRFQASLHRGGAERIVLEADLGAQEGTKVRWRDVSVALPPGEGDFSLLLETQPVADAQTPYAAAGWGAPSVVCRVERVGDPAPPERPHVVFISIDTLRADHLGTYGYRRATSPTLDRLADESLVFERAFATAPWTLPSHASMFTGLYPEEHGAGRSAPRAPLPEGIPTLAEILQAAGYRTLAFTAGGAMRRSSGLDRGFSLWSDRTRATLHSVLPAIFDALGVQPERPFFLFLHTYDVHGPYEQPPDAHAFRSDAQDPRIPPQEWERILGTGHHRYQRFERFDGLEDVVAAYDSGIRFVDDGLAGLFARLKEIGVWDDTLIVVTSDHGESLYDRGLYIGHTYTLHDDVVRVPLLVRLPKARQVARLEGLVDLTDLLPLVLEEVGLPAPEGLSGSNPLRREEGSAPPREFVRGEASHTGARYARSSQWKLIRATDPGGDAKRIPSGLRDRFEGGEQRFDLAADPLEQHNLARNQEEAADVLVQLGARLDAVPPAEAPPKDLAPIDDEEAARLRQLGYVE
jgi:arylsulfatase A-like enzyme